MRNTIAEMAKVNTAAAVAWILRLVARFGHVSQFGVWRTGSQKGVRNDQRQPGNQVQVRGGEIVRGGTPTRNRFGRHSGRRHLSFLPAKMEGEKLN